ncbi:pentapeptide repeat-containing protein [Streptomyces olivochromogenes]|uniref:pentapeptide repeat-containing protein n=1 Tax=Streptomyces olivochromogenes TaxID=1963 RepID=UPI0036D7E78B
MPDEPDPAASGHKAGEREVRLMVISIMRQHLQAPDAATSWCTYRLDFTGAVFDGGNFSESHFRGEVDFGGATLSGGTVDFGGATLSGGTVDFNRAILSGATVDFHDATLSGATVNWGPLPVPSGA